MSVIREMYSAVSKQSMQSNIGVASYGAQGHVPPRLTTVNFFSALWPVQSLTATICRQLPPVKPCNICMCLSWHQILTTPLNADVRTKDGSWRTQRNVSVLHMRRAAKIIAQQAININGY